MSTKESLKNSLRKKIVPIVAAGITALTPNAQAGEEKSAEPKESAKIEQILNEEKQQQEFWALVDKKGKEQAEEMADIVIKEDIFEKLSEKNPDWRSSNWATAGKGNGKGKEKEIAFSFVKGDNGSITVCAMPSGGGSLDNAVWIDNQGKVFQPSKEQKAELHKKLKDVSMPTIFLNENGDYAVLPFLDKGLNSMSQGNLGVSYQFREASKSVENAVKSVEKTIASLLKGNQGH